MQHARPTEAASPMRNADRATTGLERCERRAILFIARSGHLAGSERRLALILLGLDRQRYDPLVVAPTRGSFVDFLLARSERVIIRPQSGPLHRWIFPLITLPRILKHEHIKLVHLHGPRLSSVVATACGLPVVEAITMSRAIPQRFASRNPRVDRWFARWPQRIIVPSQHTASELVARGIPSHKIDIVYNAVWPELEQWRAQPDRIGVRRELGIADDALLVGLFGRLEPQKGPADFVRAALQLAPEHPAAHFIIAGDGSLRDALAQQIGVAGRARIHMLGFRSDIYRMLTALDIAVCASLWEPLANHILESMAAGLPVVATDVGGTPEAVVHEQTGLLVPPGRADLLAAALDGLLRDPALRQRLGSAGRLRGDRFFSLAAMAGRMAQIYEACLPDRGTSHHPCTSPGRA